MVELVCQSEVSCSEELQSLFERVKREGLGPHDALETNGQTREIRVLCVLKLRLLQSLASAV